MPKEKKLMVINAIILNSDIWCRSMETLTKTDIRRLKSGEMNCCAPLKK